MNIFFVVFIIIVLFGIIEFLIIIKIKGTNKNQLQIIEKNIRIEKLFNQWIINDINHKTLSEYLKKKGYNVVGIYGVGDVGKRIIDDLLYSDITVKYAIDINASNLYYKDIDIFKPSEILPESDAIIISAIYCFDDIQKRILKGTKTPLISIEEIIYNI